jgi:hypothetical protein
LTHFVEGPFVIDSRMFQRLIVPFLTSFCCLLH